MFSPRTRRMAYGILASTLILSPFVAMAAWNAVITVPVTVKVGVQINSATSDGATCTVGATITCPLENLNLGASFPVVVTIQNLASVSQTITFTTSSSILTFQGVAPASGFVLSSGMTQAFTLTFLGSTAGTWNLDITVSAT